MFHTFIHFRATFCYMIKYINYEMLLVHTSNVLRISHSDDKISTILRLAYIIFTEMFPVRASANNIRCFSQILRESIYAKRGVESPGHHAYTTTHKFRAIKIKY